jgi:hypothetical protein
MLAHQPPIVANSILWAGAVLLPGAYSPASEKQDFVSCAAAGLTS